MIPYLAIVLHAAWVVLAFVALMSWRRRRAVDDTPDVPMAKLRPGMAARIQGRTAFHGAARTSPLGGHPAVWFAWAVERDHPRSDRSTLAAGSATEPFALVDAAGDRMLVWPAKAEVLEAGEETWENEYPATIDAALRDRLVRGVDLAEPLTDASRLHFTERWLPAGSACFVLGRVEAPGPEHGPDVRGLMRERGEGDFLIVAGVPRDALAALRRQAMLCAIGALAAFVAAVLATIAA